MGTLTSGELGTLVFLGFLTIAAWCLGELVLWLFRRLVDFVLWLLDLDVKVTCPGCAGAGCVPTEQGGWQRCNTCAGVGDLVTA